MFCSKCGTNGEGLKFCKNCGNRLIGGAEDVDGTPGKMLDNILTTLCVVVIFGFGILVGLVAVLLGYGIDTQVVTIISVVYLLSIFAICFTLARQANRLINARLRAISSETDVPRTLPRAETAQLMEFREPLMSVTDPTTRALDEVSVKRTS